MKILKYFLIGINFSQRPGIGIYFFDVPHNKIKEILPTEIIL